jgi:hypothetical protein
MHDFDEFSYFTLLRLVTLLYFTLLSSELNLQCELFRHAQDRP